MIHGLRLNKSKFRDAGCEILLCQADYFLVLQILILLLSVYVLVSCFSCTDVRFS